MVTRGGAGLDDGADVLSAKAVTVPGDEAVDDLYVREVVAAEPTVDEARPPAERVALVAEAQPAHVAGGDDPPDVVALDATRCPTRAAPVTISTSLR